MTSKEKLPPAPEFVTQPKLDDDGVQATAGIRPDGKEEVDPTPLAPPAGYNAPPDLMTMIRTMIQSEEIRRKLAEEDMETFEEADDFEIPDDPLDPLTPYEEVFMPPKQPEPVPAPTPAPAPAAPKPEVLDTSGLGDTSPEPKKTTDTSKKD